MKNFMPEFDMRFGSVPCWYELSWEEQNCALIVRIHKDFLRNAHVIPHNVDTPFQQLTFLAGLDVLHDMIREKRD